MAHLGNRVTALVDDALDESEWYAVHAHLLVCEPCRNAVRRERHLKSRMTCGTTAPAPPAALVAALADRRALAEHVARQERRRVDTAHGLFTVGGLCASLTVLGVLAGGSSAARQPAPGFTRGPQPATAVVSGTSDPSTTGARLAERSGTPATRPRPEVIASLTGRTALVARALGPRFNR